MNDRYNILRAEALELAHSLEKVHDPVVTE